MAMLERKVSAIAVTSFAAEPLGEETLLSLALIREIAPEERPERWVSFDSIVEPLDQRVDRRRATDTRKNIATDEATMCLGMSQKSAVLHALLFSYWRRSYPSMVWVRKLK
jgi:hypothetical protein